jgi:dCMP deaminase
MDWIKEISSSLRKKIITTKLNLTYQRPSFLDIIAMQTLVISKRSVCLFYEVGAIIFRENQVLSTGYNGPASGDVHCSDVGCKRIIEGVLHKGSGKCRGSHAELNAIGNAAKNGVKIDESEMMITFRPCFACAKQIANMKIRKIYFLRDYDGDEDVIGYLQDRSIELVNYRFDKNSICKEILDEEL